MYLSSAEGIDSQLFDMYKLCFQKMLVGDPDYFVCDIDCQLSLHPYKDGKPMKPLVSQATIDAAFKTNPYKATREYYNKFDNDAGEDVFLRRSVIRKACQTYYPVHENEDGKKKYIIAYDPATKLDNSIIMVAEIFRDEQRGLMAKFVECINLIEETASGQKMVIQKPEQLEILKNVIVKFNKGAVDYDNIINLCLDAGAGGGGMDIGQYLMKEFIGPDGMLHRGWIDLEDPYMSIRADDYPGNCDKLTMFNFKRDKVNAYERTQSAVNQGLVIFPNSIANKHWKEELSIFLNELLKYTPKEYKLADSFINNYFICYFDSLNEVEYTVKHIMYEYPNEIPYNISSNFIYDKWVKLTSEFRIKSANGDKFSFYDLYFLS